MHFPLWLLFALMTLVLWGVGSITQKLATNWIPTGRCFVWFVLAMVAIALTLLPASSHDWNLSRGVFWEAVLGGALNGLGAMTSFMALERGGKASIVIPLCYLYPVITILLAVAFLHEIITRAEVGGIVLAMAAAFLLSREGVAET
jgi:transporter family protein